jgi:hypothetical protein
MLSEQLITTTSRLLSEQTQSYKRLAALVGSLGAALAAEDIERIERIAAQGERELLVVRGRLVAIASALTAFSERRARADAPAPLQSEVRRAFEDASTELVTQARAFQALCRQTAFLSWNGLAFINHGLEACGGEPTGYSNLHVGGRTSA